MNAVSAQTESVFSILMKYFVSSAKELTDTRIGTNIRYSMQDIARGAFSVFFTQCPSFLSRQHTIRRMYGMSNAETIFGMDKTPSDSHIREVLDHVSPAQLHTIFTDCISMLEKHKQLDQFKAGPDNTILLALDGTWYFSSENIHCSKCSIRKRAETTTYMHGMINPAIVAPKNRHVIALPPEFIVPQDGDRKQDCEHKAAKRWIAQHGSFYAEKNVTILGDDLYSHEPLVKELAQKGFHYLLVCKPNSHKTLYEWVKGITETITLHTQNKGKKETWVYKYVNEVPLKDGKDALMVNWCELTIVREDGRRLYKNAFVTDHKITGNNIEHIIICGRTRWKIENENNNTLKTKGYHLEHNFGHGKKHLASFLATMNILAFLFHTTLHLTNTTYKELRKKLGRRDVFFQHIRTLFSYAVFRSFDSLMEYMTDDNRPDLRTAKMPI